MLNDIKTQHREIARLRFEGKKPAEIASLLDYKLTSVYAILRDPLMKNYLQSLHDEADAAMVSTRKRLSDLSTDAVNALRDLLDPVDATVPPSVRLNAAKDVLDRNGFKPATEVNVTHGHFTAADLLELKKRAEEAEKGISRQDREEAIEV